MMIGAIFSLLHHTPLSHLDSVHIIVYHRCIWTLSILREQESRTSYRSYGGKESWICIQGKPRSLPVPHRVLVLHSLPGWRLRVPILFLLHVRYLRRPSSGV